MVSAYERLVKRGGFRGLGITLISQRSASLNKDVLSQIATLIAMQTTAKLDRDAILGWVKHNALGQEMVDQLPELAQGDAWIFSPAWLRLIKPFRFRRRRTFDSGKTPEVGVKVRPPAHLTEIDLAGLRDHFASAIEHAKQHDPAELQRRIRELTRANAALVAAAKVAKPGTIVKEKEVRVEVPRVPHDLWKAIQDASGAVEAAIQRLGDTSRLLRLAVTMAAKYDPELSRGFRQSMALEARRLTKEVMPNDRRREMDTTAAGARLDMRAGAQVAPIGHQSVPKAPAPSSNGELAVSNPQQRILDALAWAEAVRITLGRDQLALLAGASHKSSTYANNLGALRSAGLVTPSPDVRLTPAGRQAANQPEETPSSEAVQASVLARLNGSQQKMLRVLISLHPDGADREQLAELAEASSTSSTFANNIGRLRSLGLATAGWPVRATDLLFVAELAVR